MSLLPEASVLTFVAIKIFLILPNSMAEERTVSRFTQNNTVDCASQDASTIVAMTKIYQHNQRVAAASTPKPIKKSKSPTLNWRSVRDLMKEPEPIRMVPATTPATDAATSSNTIPPITRTAACEDSLAAVKFLDPDDTAPTTSPSFAETEINSRRDSVDITLPFFRDLLLDKPIPSAHEIGSLGDWQETAAGGAKSGKKAAGSLMWQGEVVF
ncbi:hypothetical protein B0H19DRAFT_1261441 [Mycena capillaripes]|nr:hypothetical protein B0H19DRAFT_1261441 [Mycena capillaripes]